MAGAWVALPPPHPVGPGRTEWRADGSLRAQCHVRHKDIRKFLDGCYISEKGHVVKDTGGEEEKK